MAASAVVGRLAGIYGVVVAFISLFSTQLSYGQMPISVDPTDVPCYFSNVFRCASGNQCIVPYYECDSIVDCVDRTDESNCQAQHIEQCVSDFSGKLDENNNPLAIYTCNSGQCVLGCKRCDRCLDCYDNSDEIDCTLSELLNRPPCS